MARNVFISYEELDEGLVKNLIQALVLSRLDYCNSILANLPDVTLACLRSTICGEVDSKSEEAGSTDDEAPE